MIQEYHHLDKRAFCDSVSFFLFSLFFGAEDVPRIAPDKPHVGQKRGSLPSPCSANLDPSYQLVLPMCGLCAIPVPGSKQPAEHREKSCLPKACFQNSNWKTVGSISKTTMGSHSLTTHMSTEVDTDDLSPRKSIK